MAVLSFIGTDNLKTIVYVDGYNLYYGLLRKSNHKWLNLFSLFQDHVLEYGTEVMDVRFYTAPVLGKMSDDPASQQRQRQYLQALRKMPPKKITIIEGTIVASTPSLRLVETIPGLPQRVRVHDFTEKKTDVNLASDLICGGFQKKYEQAVLCSNDSDFAPALNALRTACPHVRIGVVAPISADDHRYIATDLIKHAHWAKKLSLVHVANAQLPNKIPGTTIYKPESWSTDY